MISGLTFTQRGNKQSHRNDVNGFIDDEGEGFTETEFRSDYLTAYILKQIPIQPSIDLLVGAEIGHYLNGNTKGKICYNSSDCNKYDEDIDSDDWHDLDGKSTDYGILLGGKYMINKHISVVGTYYIGMAIIIDSDIEDLKYRSYQLNLVYSFK